MSAVVETTERDVSVRPDARFLGDAQVEAADVLIAPDMAEDVLIGDVGGLEPRDALAPMDISAPDMFVTPDLGTPPTAAHCFESAFVSETPTIGPDYDQFEPMVGSHCMGTNHQVIEDIERVVFVGDSVTVGTPPQDPSQYYRARLARTLSDRFGLMPPDLIWEQVNLIEGTSLSQRSGAFASCARYGARTDDLLEDNSLLSDCFEPEDFDRRTLIVMTIGGNDISSLTQDGIDGDSPENLWAKTERFVSLFRDAVRWLTAPGRFPNGVSVVFANMFEFTDGTGDVSACPAAGLAGFGASWDDPDLLASMVIWANEQYMSIAVESGIDMIFMLEHFCGHGFNAQDPAAPCYRGPDAETWFDLTCIHPNTAGHAEIERLFSAVIAE
jgi:lysophospholipase L1-like esterase